MPTKYEKTTRVFVREDIQLGSLVAETSLVTSYTLSRDERENRNSGTNKEPSV
jgi:hypothetical protein